MFSNVTSTRPRRSTWAICALACRKSDPISVLAVTPGRRGSGSGASRGSRGACRAPWPPRCPPRPAGRHGRGRVPRRQARGRGDGGAKALAAVVLVHLDRGDAGPAVGDRQPGDREHRLAVPDAHERLLRAPRSAPSARPAGGGPGPGSGTWRPRRRRARGSPGPRGRPGARPGGRRGAGRQASRRRDPGGSATYVRTNDDRAPRAGRTRLSRRIKRRGHRHHRWQATVAVPLGSPRRGPRRAACPGRRAAGRSWRGR